MSKKKKRQITATTISDTLPEATREMLLLLKHRLKDLREHPEKYVKNQKHEKENNQPKDCLDREAIFNKKDMAV